MGYRGGGEPGIAVLRGSTGLSQADNQVFDQLRKMSSAFIVAKLEVVEFRTLSYPRQPVFNHNGRTTLQYRGHSFLWRTGSRFTSEQLFVDELCELPGFEWFHDDIVRLQQGSVHSALHVGVAADQQRKGVRLGVAHRGNHRKTISEVRHV